MEGRIKNAVKDYFPIIIMAVCIAAGAAAVISGKITVEGVYRYIMQNKAEAAAILLGLYALKSVTVVIYYSLLVALSGFVFDLPVALLINSAGTVICLTISYFIGYKIKSENLLKKLDKHPKVKKYFDKCETNSFLVSYILHALGLSTEVLGLVFGFLKMPYIKYLVSSFIAIAPGMVCVTIFGKELDITSPAFWAAVAVEATVIITAYIYSKKKLLVKKG